ncbi:hypothetical protein BJV82DRAFT_670627 [Fennellomyces sp. T-0311]|nr:hypothetical protein BJV82DRAFT_670627 [Fennellomyces sp. T-0311]
MELLYRMPASLHCSQKRSHSPSSSLPRQIFKKKKQVHDLSHYKSPVKDVPVPQPALRNDIVRIHDMDAFLADGEEGPDYGDYTVLHGNKDHEIVDVKLKDGQTLPMERRMGESKLRIPNFVLNNSNAEESPDNSRALIRYQPPGRLAGATEGTLQQKSDDEGMEVDTSEQHMVPLGDDAMEID